MTWNAVTFSDSTTTIHKGIANYVGLANESAVTKQVDSG